MPHLTSAPAPTGVDPARRAKESPTAGPGWRVLRLFRPSLARSVLFTVGTVATAALVFSEHGQPASSIRSLDHVRWWWLPGAVGAGTASMVAMSTMHRRLLHVAGLPMSRWSTAAVVYASNAISGSVPVAGSELGTAYMFAWYQRLGAGRITAAWKLTVSGVVSSITFALLVSVGALASGSAAAGWLGAVGVGVVLAAIGLLVAVTGLLGLRLRMAEMASAALRRAQRYSERPRGDVDELIANRMARAAALRLGPSDWAAVVGAASLNWLADVACLALAIEAVGLHVPWSVLVLAWAAGVSVSTLSFTPGGLGFTEVAIAAALVTTSHRATADIAAVLLYRLVSYWMPLVVGWGAYLVHRGRPDVDRVQRGR